MSDPSSSASKSHSMYPRVVVKRLVSRSVSLSNSVAAPVKSLQMYPRAVVKRSISRSVSLSNSVAAPAKSKVMDSGSPLQQAKSCTPSSTLGKVLARKVSLLSSEGLKGISGSDVSHGMAFQQTTTHVNCIEIPSGVASWSGRCKIYNTSQCLEAIHKFQAHPSSRVHKKVYEFSKSMPDILRFELIPRCDIWADVDHHLRQEKRDIDLYFFPVNKERWDEYDRLLEVMQQKDYAMRASFEDTKLLILSSRVLSSSCQQWEGRHFLWGLFRQVDKPLVELKKNKFLIDVEMEEEVDMTEDMDIDMVGGKEIPGRQDFVPPPPPYLPIPRSLSVQHARPLYTPPLAPSQHELPLTPPLKKLKAMGK